MKRSERKVVKLERKKKIIATSWHPGGINAIIPVIKRLIGENIIDVVVIGYQFSEKILQTAGINYKTIDFYGLQDVSVDSMRRLLQVESPDLILTGTAEQDDKNRDVIEQTLTIAARQRNIKSLAVLNFWSNYSLRFSDIFTGEKFKFLPDQIAIMDSFAEQEMLDEGFDKEMMVITGNPHFDNPSEKAKDFTKEKGQIIREKIELISDCLVFFAGNTFKKEKDSVGYWDLDIIDLAIKTFKILNSLSPNQIGLAIKLHPRAPLSDFLEIKQYIDDCSDDRIKLVTDIETQELVLASDLTLTSISTVGIEAVLMGRPCISLQPNLKGKDLLVVSKKGLIPVGYTMPGCREELMKAILDKKYREEELPKRSSIFFADGKATERVVAEIYKILE